MKVEKAQELLRDPNIQHYSNARSRIEMAAFTTLTSFLSKQL